MTLISRFYPFFRYSRLAAAPFSSLDLISLAAALVASPLVLPAVTAQTSQNAAAPDATKNDVPSSLEAPQNVSVFNEMWTPREENFPAATGVKMGNQK